MNRDALWLMLGVVVLYYGGILVLSSRARAHQRWLWRIPDHWTWQKILPAAFTGALVYVVALALVIGVPLGAIWWFETGR